MTHVSAALRAEVRERAKLRCEYCRLPEHASPFRFHIEHIIAIQHGGYTLADNLAWACVRCNASKGPNIASYDPETGDLTPLYHPRQQQWEDHFDVVAGEILGKTPIGRVTVKLLRFNVVQRLEQRQDLIASGEW